MKVEDRGAQAPASPLTHAGPLTRSASLTFYGMMAYAVLSLIAMATMSIGAAIVISAIVFEPKHGGPRGFWRELRELFAERPTRLYTWASAALVLACVLSLVSARLYPLTFGSYDPQPVHWLGDLGKMWYFAFPLVLVTGWRRLPLERQACVLKAWLICFGVLSAVGVQQVFTGLPRAQANPLLPGYFHATLFLGHHLSVASIWIFPFFAGLELLIKPKLRQRIGLGFGFLIPALACAAFTLILGYSRTLWIALPAGLVLWSLLRLPLKATALGLLSLGAFGGAASQLEIIQRRLQTTMGTGDRYELWKANLLFFENRPIFGIGFGKNQGLTYDYFRQLRPGQTDFFIGHAHNIYLEVLAGTGLFGALAWLCWIGLLLATLVRVIKKPTPLSFAGAALAAWFVFLINGTTQVNFWEGKVLHQVMWMAGLILFWGTAHPGKEAPSFPTTTP